jgi:hypothetical protein
VEFDEVAVKAIYFDSCGPVGILRWGKFDFKTLVCLSFTFLEMLGVGMLI